MKVCGGMWVIVPAAKALSLITAAVFPAASPCVGIIV